MVWCVCVWRVWYVPPALTLVALALTLVCGCVVGVWCVRDLAALNLDVAPAADDLDHDDHA